MEHRLLQRLGVSQTDIDGFCRTNRITSLGLFGSVLTENFSADSDIDVLITIDETWDYSLLDLAGIKDDLEALFQRPVDLLTKRAVLGGRNPERKAKILSTAQVVYDAA